MIEDDPRVAAAVAAARCHDLADLANARARIAELEGQVECLKVELFTERGRLEALRGELARAKAGTD